MFKRIFGQGSGGGGGPAGPRPNVSSTAQTVDAIQKLGETEELLIKRRTLLEKKIAQELEKAKGYSKAQNKRAALMALKKKKMYETQLEQCENNILRVNEQQMMLENQRTTVETVSALRDAAHASKYTMSEMKITDVDQVLDEINEQTDQMQQIQDAMAQPIGPAADVDEDELMGELENLESEQLDDQLLEPAPVPTARPAQPQAQLAHAQAARPQANSPMPNVPHSRPAQAARPAKSKEEEELEALEREMAV
ncbi:g10318 [Coccomyxa viridis]|uniref:G10318 protein n=1 Tax=Coccomyxa viridis TaxID=1274662 RepID=A0ABP1GC37_9CHLO